MIFIATIWDPRPHLAMGVFVSGHIVERVTGRRVHHPYHPLRIAAVEVPIADIG